MATSSTDGDPGPRAADRDGVDALFSLTYEELRRLAARVKHGDSATLDPTGLVHEAWVKLARSAPSFGPNGAPDRLHFKRLAARAMRQVLVEAARRRKAAKRGAGLRPVAFDEALHPGPAGAEELLALDAALAELSLSSPRQAAMVEARFFAGLDERECAEALGVSETTVQRDWRVARAWLSSRLRADR